MICFIDFESYFGASPTDTRLEADTVGVITRCRLAIDANSLRRRDHEGTESIASLHDHLRDYTITPADCKCHDYEMRPVNVITKMKARDRNKLTKMA